MKSSSITGIFILGIFYTAYLTRDVLLPIILALLFTLLLRPVVRLLKKIKIPEVVSAALLILLFLSIAGYGVSTLTDPVGEWINKAPETFRALNQKFKHVLKPVEKAGKTAEELKKITGTGNEKNRVAVKPGPGLAEALLAGMQNFITKGTVMLVLLFFLLASGDLFLHKLMNVLPGCRGKKQVIVIVRDVEQSISRYLLTVTAINIGDGILVGLGMFLIGMPDPVLWGVMAALLIYIPYLGPLVGIFIVFLVALITMDTFEKALLAPIIYLSIEILQGQFVTPWVLGVRFSMNPVVIFIWLIFWGWMWGIIGALIAVPLLAVLKILCEHILPLKPVGEFLSS